MAKHPYKARCIAALHNRVHHTLMALLGRFTKLAPNSPLNSWHLQGRETSVMRRPLLLKYLSLNQQWHRTQGGGGMTSFLEEEGQTWILEHSVSSGNRKINLFSELCRVRTKTRHNSDCCGVEGRRGCFWLPADLHPHSATNSCTNQLIRQLASQPTNKTVN